MAMGDAPPGKRIAPEDRTSYQIAPLDQHVHGVEKAFSTGTFLAGFIPQYAPLITGTIESEGDQVRCQQCVRQAVYAVAEGIQVGLSINLILPVRVRGFHII